MRRVFAVLLTAMFAGSSAHGATSVSFNGGSGIQPANVIVFQDFESLAGGTPGASIGPNAFIYDNSVAGQAARPNFGSTGNFATVQTGGSFTVNFGPTQRFSFILGSLDTYNILTLFYDDSSSQAYIGGQIINDLVFPSGDQISGETNGVVTFSISGPERLISARFESSQNSFEFDNLATAVPEPASWAMMIGGFGLIGAAARRPRVMPKHLLA